MCGRWLLLRGCWPGTRALIQEVQETPSSTPSLRPLSQSHSCPGSLLLSTEPRDSRPGRPGAERRAGAATASHRQATVRDGPPAGRAGPRQHLHREVRRGRGSALPSSKARPQARLSRRGLLVSAESTRAHFPEEMQRSGARSRTRQVTQQLGAMELRPDALWGLSSQTPASLSWGLPRQPVSLPDTEQARPRPLLPPALAPWPSDLLLPGAWLRLQTPGTGKSWKRAVEMPRHP